MATKTASIVLADELRFQGRVGSGHTLILDDGKGDGGMRPAELVPLALAGCTAMDVISILRKKRQDVHSYRVDAVGVQMDDHPHAFTRVDVTHVVSGVGIEVEAVRRAIELSATRYCSVGSTLAAGVTEIHHAFELHDEAAGTIESGVVVVIGPHASLGALAGSAA